MKKKQVSPKEFLEIELSAGISPDNPAFISLAEGTLKTLRKKCAELKIDIANKSFIDFGAGVGVYSETFRANGCKIKALDIWKSHRDFMAERFPLLEVISKPEKADVMIFIETAEHMTDDQITAALSDINPELILFSSTSQVTENDEEWGHINVKEQPDWVEFFDMLGYEKVSDLKHPTKWSFLLKRI